jgi:AcrR family transcriptional regulator
MTRAGADQPAQLSLRERNKARTRAELEQAAFALFADRGFDAVTVEDIASASGVSRRTFFRYFDSKEDVLLADLPERLATLRSALKARLPDEAPMTAVRNAFLEVAGGYESRRTALEARARIMSSTPSLLARSLERQAEWEKTVSAMVADRLGLTDASLGPAVLAAATLAASRVAMDAWLDGDDKTQLQALTGEAMDLVAGGLQQLNIDFAPKTE